MGVESEGFRRARRRRERIVAEELDDGCNEPYFRGVALRFPVVDGARRYSDLLRNLLLKEPQVQSTLPDVVA
jgi:hypothetical protein